MVSALNTNESSDNLSDQDFPAVIGRFMPKKVLGRGGQGVVYLAEDPKLERQVAIKTLLTNDADPTRLIGEAKNVASLDHPGIVPVYEIESTDDSVYLVYQFVPGDTLNVWLKNNETRKPKDSVNLIKQILDAIAYAHSKGIIHRDLSPVNVIVDNSSRAKILDFGISTIVGAKDTDTAVVGTMKYLPPECLSNGDIGPHSDVYTIAVMFHEMLTGRALFDAENSMAVAYKIVNEKIPAPSFINNDIDEGLDKIVMTGLAREPDNRYENAGEMLKALEDYLSDDEEITNDESVYSSAIEFMLRRVTRKPDFPAVSRYITEISQKTGDRGSSDASELADVILKDYALTSKLLRLVNSAVFGHYGGSIGTVSRAVVILGFDQVRAAALSIAVFEHLQNGQQADTLKDAACSSFLSAMLARDLVDDKSGVDPEQAFIGAMFHRLGRHLAIYYFPEEYEDVKSLVASKGISETAAVKEILGTSYAEFGLAIGEQWNLPPAMLRCMKPLPEGKIPASVDIDGKMVETAGLANELAEICGTSSEQELDSRLNALKQRYADCVKLDTKVLREKVELAIDATREYANVLSVDLESADFFGQVVKHFGGNQESDSAASEANQSVTEISQTLDKNISVPPPADRKSFLVDAITELTTAMINKASPNEILAMVVKSIYQGLGMSHVFLLIRDPKRHVMQARSGHGKDLDKLLPEFGFKISKQQDIFNQALRKGKEFIVLDVDHEQYKNLVPAWCRDLIEPSSILLFPVMANGNCIGMVYADQTGGYAKISADEFKLLVTLVQQASLAIQQRA